MVKKRPQLKLDELHQLKWGLGSALAALSAWTAFYLEIEAGFWVLTVTMAALAVVIWPTLPSRVPAVLHRFAFPVIVAAFAYDLYATRQPLPSMVRLELMLLLYRVVSYRRRRDDLQLLLLGLFLVVITGVLTVSPLFAVQIMAYTACALGFLFLTTLVDSVQAATPAVGVSGGKAKLVQNELPTWAADVKWLVLFRRVSAATDYRVMILGVLLFGGVVAVSGLLFMAIPRFEIGSSLFLDRLIKKKTRTGFSENVRFGDVTDIQEDNGIAMTVDVSDASMLPGVPYWRMVVLDEYREGGFHMSREVARYFLRPERRSRVVDERSISGKGDQPWRFYFEPGVSRYIPLGGSFRYADFSRPVTLAHSSTLRMIALTTEPADLLGFQVAGMEMSAVLKDPDFANREQGRVERGWAPDYRKMLLEPEELETVKLMVAEFSQGTELSPEDFARKACEWLGKKHSYSMQSSLTAGPTDPLVRWMESQGPGHCEFFAGAFALLANSAGHPVRIVTGFKGGSWNAFSNSLIVRHSHAHAWCELWNGRDAWVRVDPTPGTTAAVGEPTREVAAAEARGRTIDSDWSARLDSLRVFWYRRVVNFDQGAQVELALEAKKTFGGLFLWIRQTTKSGLDRTKGWFEQPWSGRRTFVALGIIAAGVLIIWSGRVFGRKWGWRAFAGFRARADGDPVRREASRWLQRIRLVDLETLLPDGDLSGARAELQRLRFGPTVSGTAAVSVFGRARQALARAKKDRRRQLSARSKERA